MRSIVDRLDARAFPTPDPEEDDADEPEEWVDYVVPCGIVLRLDGVVRARRWHFADPGSYAGKVGFSL